MLWKSLGNYLSSFSVLDVILKKDQPQLTDLLSSRQLLNNNTLWHTTNAICWFSVAKLVTLTHLFTKEIFCCHMNRDSLQSARCHHL